MGPSSPIVVFFVAAAVASLMFYAAVGKRALEPKRPIGRCRGCGRPRRSCRCRR
jgi:hypothetical protein